jgi:hypothetical protein
MPRRRDRFHLLHKSVAFAPPSHRVPVQINKFQFPEGLEDLLDIGFGKVEMQGTNVKSGVQHVTTSER